MTSETDTQIGEDETQTDEDETQTELSTAVDDSQTRFSRAELAADARTLVERIEAIHPDPYVGYDGRVDLHRTLEETVRELPETATAEEFYRIAAPLVTGLEDVHSKLLSPTHSGETDRRLPLSFRVVGDALYVDAVYENGLTDVLGARLESVVDVDLESLTERAVALRGAENRSGALSNCARMLEEYDPIARLVDRPEPPADLSIGVSIDGTATTRTLESVPESREPVLTLESSIPQPEGTGPRYRCYDGGRAAVFVPGDLLGFREAIDAANARGAGYAEEFAREAYRTHVGDDPPEELEALVDALPSMVETICELVRELRAAETDVLFVDLRDNRGGDSRFVFHLVYALWGWDGIVDLARATTAYKRRTPQHRDHYGLPEHAADEYSTFEDNPADYDFGPAFRMREATPDDVREQFATMLTSEAFRAELESEAHEGYYCPDRVIAVTTARTMSSAFAGVAQLSDLGAEVVGVPSGQAPISFGEAVETALPATELTAKIAGSMYAWVAQPDGDTLSMDRELTPELFEQYDRAADAPLRLAFDYADVTPSK